MANHFERLCEILTEYEPRLRALSDADTATKRGDGDSWSRKEEMGHLVDSATNNRVRFMRAALEGEYEGPSYDGNGWVRLGGYAVMPWGDVVDLWKSLNRALAVLVERIPEERLEAKCRVGGDAEATLDFVMADYLRHMVHHLDHVVS